MMLNKYIFISAVYYYAELKNAEAQFAREKHAMANAALEAERQANAARKVESLDEMLNKERQKMRLTIAAIALLLPPVLSVSASPSPPAQPVAIQCPTLPAPPAWAMIPPPTQTSTERLRNAFLPSPVTISEK